MHVCQLNDELDKHTKLKGGSVDKGDDAVWCPLNIEVHYCIPVCTAGFYKNTLFV